MKLPILPITTVPLTSHGRRYVTVVERFVEWFARDDEGALRGLAATESECIYELSRESQMAWACVEEWARRGEPFGGAVKAMFAARHDQMLIEALGLWWRMRIVDPALARHLTEAEAA